MKCRSLFGLAAALALVACVALVSSVNAQEAKYVGNAKCKVCHNKADKGKAWDVWKASKHANALASLKTDAAKEMAKKKGVAGDPATAPECLECHVMGYDVAKKAAPEGILAEDGVQCESCHGKASLHTEDAKKKMKGETVDMAAHIKKAVTEEDCKKCHNEKSPAYKPFDFKAMSEKIKHSAAK